MAEVAEGVFEAAEDLVIGEIDEFVGEAFQDAVGRAAEGLEELLATFFTTFGGASSGRSGIVYHRNLPGVRSSVTQTHGSNFP